MTVLLGLGSQFTKAMSGQGALGLREVSTNLYFPCLECG